MAIADDISIDYNNKIVDWDGNYGFYTSRAFYSYLMSVMDDADQMDDTVMIEGNTPTSYKIINGWYITKALIKHLKGGSIETDGYTDDIRVLSFDSSGYTNAVAGDIGKTVRGTSPADSGTLLEYDNTALKWFVRMDNAGDLFDAADTVTVETGTGSGVTSGASVTGENLSFNAYSLGSTNSGNIVIEQNSLELTSWWDGSASGIKKLTFDSGGYVSAVSGDIGRSVTGGSPVSSGILAGYNNTSREWFVYIDYDTDDFSEVTTYTVSGGTGQGVLSSAATWAEGNSSGESTSGDSNAGSATFKHIDVLVEIQEADTEINSGLISAFNRNFGDTYDHATIDGTGGGRIPMPLATQDDSTNITLTEAEAEDYTDGTLASIAVAFGSYSADVDNDGSNESYSVQIDCDNQDLSVVYQAMQYLCEKDRSGTLNSVLAKFYISYDPATYTPVKSAPFGNYAGGIFLCAQGVYLIKVPSGDASNYRAKDTSGTQVTPPTTVTVQVTGLIGSSPYDRVAVFKTSGGNIVKDMFTSHASNNVDNDTEFEVQETIPADTPATGYIRVVDTSTTTEQRYEYESWSGSIFTLKSSPAVRLDRAYDGTDTAYVGYIDDQATSASISVALQYVSDRSVQIYARNNAHATSPMKPAEATSTIANTGMSVPISRVVDNITS